MSVTSFIKAFLFRHCFYWRNHELLPRIFTLRILSLIIILLVFKVVWNKMFTIKPTQITNCCFLTCSIIASLHQSGLRPPFTKAAPAKCRGAKNSWAQPWGNLGCDWPTQIESQAVSQSEARVKQNSYRSGPVTEPPLGGRGVNVRDWRQSKTESGTSSTN